MAARLVSSTKDSLSAPSAAPQIMSCQVLSAASNPLENSQTETEVALQLLCLVLLGVACSVHNHQILSAYHVIQEVVFCFQG